MSFQGTCILSSGQILPFWLLEIPLFDFRWARLSAYILFQLQLLPTVAYHQYLRPDSYEASFTWIAFISIKNQATAPLWYEKQILATLPVSNRRQLENICKRIRPDKGASSCHLKGSSSAVVCHSYHRCHRCG